MRKSTKVDKSVLTGYKSILSGVIFELFQYQSFQIPFGLDNKKKAKQTLIRLINTNAGQWFNKDTGKRYLPLFLTLTFRENIQDVSEGNQFFLQFIKRFNYQILHSKKALLKYTAVIEFQDSRNRGAVHYHVILYNTPFIPDIFNRVLECWQNGGIFINAIKDIRNTGLYVTKYMTKDIDDTRLKGRRSYLNSRGLIRPRIDQDEFMIYDLLTLLPANSLLREYNLEGLDYQKHAVHNSFLRELNTSRSIKSVSSSLTPIFQPHRSEQQRLFP